MLCRRLSSCREEKAPFESLPCYYIQMVGDSFYFPRSASHAFWLTTNEEIQMYSSESKRNQKKFVTPRCVK